MRKILESVLSLALITCAMAPFPVMASDDVPPRLEMLAVKYLWDKKTTIVYPGLAWKSLTAVEKEKVASELETEVYIASKKMMETELRDGILDPDQVATQVKIGFTKAYKNNVAPLVKIYEAGLKAEKWPRDEVKRHLREYENYLWWALAQYQVREDSEVSDQKRMQVLAHIFAESYEASVEARKNGNSESAKNNAIIAMRIITEAYAQSAAITDREKQAKFARQILFPTLFVYSTLGFVSLFNFTNPGENSALIGTGILFGGAAALVAEIISADTLFYSRGPGFLTRPFLKYALQRDFSKKTLKVFWQNVAAKIAEKIPSKDQSTYLATALEFSNKDYDHAVMVNNITADLKQIHGSGISDLFIVSPEKGLSLTSCTYGLKKVSQK